MSIWLGEAIDVMYPAVMDWIHHPSRASKRAIFDAYLDLPPRAKAAYDADVESAFRREHGATAMVYRYKAREDMGGASVSPVKPRDSTQHKAFEIRPGDVLVHYGQDEMPLGGKAFGHEKEIILRKEARPQQTLTASYSYDRRVGRTIRLEKGVIQRFVDRNLIPQIKRNLALLPQDAPLGTGDVLAEGTVVIDNVKDDRIHADVTVQSRASAKKGTAALRAWAGPVDFVRGDLRSEVVVEVNGAFTPGEILGGQEVSMGGGLAFRHDMLQPVDSCRTLQCLPFAIYHQLLHELTHVADTYNPKVDYYNEDHSVDDARYFNHPGEVRAIMQTMVEQAVNLGHKLKDHFKGNSQRLITMLLRMSDEWKIVEPHMNAQNRARVLKAVYAALVAEGIIEG